MALLELGSQNLKFHIYSMEFLFFLEQILITCLALGTRRCANNTRSDCSLFRTFYAFLFYLTQLTLKLLTLSNFDQANSIFW